MCLQLAIRITACFDLIQIEVCTGQTMVVLNTAIASGELNTTVRSIARDAYASFEAQIDSILNDC